MRRHFILSTFFLFAGQISLLSQPSMTITSAPWGSTQSGEAVTLYTLSNGSIKTQITNYGGIIVSLEIPDQAGKLADIVLGKDNLAAYEAGHPFFGTITGRYANRIAGAMFTLDGVKYKINTSGKAKHTLHGGKLGFDKKVWSAESVTLDKGVGLVLRYTSADGEEGYPGELKCTVSYWLMSDNTLRIDYEASTSKPTVVNLTNHSYFNLAGHDKGDVLGQEMQIAADHFTATDTDLIPTGEVKSLLGTPLDFSQPALIGARIGADFEPLKFGGGYDHNYVLSNKDAGLKPCAIARDPASGRQMEVRTTCPAVQLYTANHMKDVAGKNGAVYPKHAAFCLETQHYPNSPNHPEFPSTVLRPGESYRQTTTFTFSSK